MIGTHGIVMVKWAVIDLFSDLTGSPLGVGRCDRAHGIVMVKWAANEPYFAANAVHSSPAVAGGKVCDFCQVCIVTPCTW